MASFVMASSRLALVLLGNVSAAGGVACFCIAFITHKYLPAV
jgi:hypothetical protein